MEPPASQSGVLAETNLPSALDFPASIRRGAKAGNLPVFLHLDAADAGNASSLVVAVAAGPDDEVNAPDCAEDWNTVALGGQATTRGPMPQCATS